MVSNGWPMFTTHAMLPMLQVLQNGHHICVILKQQLPLLALWTTQRDPVLPVSPWGWATSRGARLGRSLGVCYSAWLGALRRPCSDCCVTGMPQTGRSCRSGQRCLAYAAGPLRTASKVWSNSAGVRSIRRPSPRTSCPSPSIRRMT